MKIPSLRVALALSCGLAGSLVACQKNDSKSGGPVPSVEVGAASALEGCYADDANKVILAVKKSSSGKVIYQTSYVADCNTKYLPDLSSVGPDVSRFSQASEGYYKSFTFFSDSIEVACYLSGSREDTLLWSKKLRPKPLQECLSKAETLTKQNKNAGTYFGKNLEQLFKSDIPDDLRSYAEVDLTPGVPSNANSPERFILENPEKEKQKLKQLFEDGYRHGQIAIKQRELIEDIKSILRHECSAKKIDTLSKKLAKDFISQFQNSQEFGNAIENLYQTRWKYLENLEISNIEFVHDKPAYKPVVEFYGDQLPDEPIALVRRPAVPSGMSSASSAAGVESKNAYAVDIRIATTAEALRDCGSRAPRNLGLRMYMIIEGLKPLTDQMNRGLLGTSQVILVLKGVNLTTLRGKGGLAHEIQHLIDVESGNLEVDFVAREKRLKAFHERRGIYEKDIQAQDSDPNYSKALKEAALLRPAQISEELMLTQLEKNNQELRKAFWEDLASYYLEPLEARAFLTQYKFFRSIGLTHADAAFYTTIGLSPDERGEDFGVQAMKIFLTQSSPGFIRRYQNTLSKGRIPTLDDVAPVAARQKK